MPIRPTTNEKTARLTESLLRWIVAELERIGKKIDNARGFARNTKETLAAHIPQTRNVEQTTSRGDHFVGSSVWDGTGTGGDGSTLPSFKYHIFNKAGNQIGTSVVPERDHLPAVTHLKAPDGSPCQYDYGGADGALRAWVGEKFDAGACPGES